MCKILKLNNCRGFTLIESLFQLIILAVFAQLFLLFFLWKAPIENEYSPVSDTAWEMFVLDLQNSLINIDEFEVHPGSRGIQFFNARGRIDIEYQNGTIRKRVYGQGHIPFLTNVAIGTFARRGETLTVTVRMLDGTQKERDFAIGNNKE